MRDIVRLVDEYVEKHSSTKREAFNALQVHPGTYYDHLKKQGKMPERRLKKKNPKVIQTEALPTPKANSGQKVVVIVGAASDIKETLRGLL